jgi:TPR repeat protein
VARPVAAASFFLFLVLFLVTSSYADFKAGMAAYERGDFLTALQQWRPLADAGMVEAQYNLGLLNYEGRGTPEDPAEAHAWFLKAAEQGFARAQYRVAEMFETGDGVRKDLIQAHLWFRLAGDQKHADARKRRRRVAKSMTPKQIAYADMLARHRKRDESVDD